MLNIPRAEYPRPQFVRDGWMNLNGIWQFEIDQGMSGRARGLVETPLKDEILVPSARKANCLGFIIPTSWPASGIAAPSLCPRRPRASG